MKKLQVAIAVATLFAASGSVLAASISQSGVTVAREVISKTDNTQKLRAPSVSFNFDNGPTANAASTQDFNITLQLGGDGIPSWDGTQLPTFRSISANRRNNGGTSVDILAPGTTAAGASALELLGVDLVSPNTLRYRFRLVNNTAVSVNLGDLQIAFNTVNPLSPPTAADYAQVTTLAASVGTIVGSTVGSSGTAADACGNNDSRVSVTARNFIGSGIGVIGESTLDGVVNNGYILFAQALNIQVGKGVAVNRTTDPGFGNTRLTTPDPSGFGGVNVMPLGFLKFTNVAGLDAWDTSIAGQYYKYRPTGVAPIDGELPVQVALNVDGDIDLPDTGTALSVAITSSNGFAAGATFQIANNPYCTTGPAGASGTSSGATGGVTYSPDGTVATVIFTGANLFAASNTNATGSQGLLGSTGATGPAPGYVATTDRFYLCYTTPGAALIPTSSFSAVATLLKQIGSNEQSNLSCRGDLAGLGGGIKIDVRNYLPYDAANTEWIGIVRVINNSESTTADLTGQYIRADGQYGRYGSLGNLPPRGARYFTSLEINNALTSLSTAGNAAAAQQTAGGLTAPAGQALPPVSRLRISSNAASTLRVQNYLYNTRTGLLSEVSASQGADFVNAESSPRDHIDQDAQTGIKK